MNGITAGRAADTRTTLFAAAALIAAAIFLALAPDRAEAASPLSLGQLLAPTSGVEIGGLRVEPGLTARGGQLLSTGSLVDLRMSRDPRRGYAVGTAADVVRITPLRTARDARDGRLAGGSAAVYDRVATATDVVIRPTASGVESFQRLNGPGAPRRFSWRISLGRGQRLEPMEDGSIALVDYSVRDGFAQGSESAYAPSGSLPITAPDTSLGGGGLLGSLRLENLLPPPVSDLPRQFPVTITALTKALNDAAAQLSGSYETVNTAGAAYPDSRIVGVFSAPWALDADGAEVPVALHGRGDVLTMTVDPSADAAYPVTADPAYSAGLATKAAAAGNAVPPEWQRGTNLVTFLKNGYTQADDGSRNAFTALAPQQGVSTVVLTPTDYVDSTNPSSINQSWSSGGYTKNESDKSIREASCAARLGGKKRRYGGPGNYEVALKPHIDITDGSFRGYIDPRGGNLDSFWSQYRALMLNEARLAIQVNASTLVVGTELTALSDDDADTARWRQLIADIRGVSAQRYKCRRPGHERGKGAPVSFAAAGIKLTYAANWDAIDRIHFWDALDMIGTDYYANGTDMQSIYSTVRGLEQQLQQSGAGTRPFLFTEIGYDGHEDPAGMDQGSPDANQNAMYWNSFMQWISAYRSGEAPWFDGFWWWDRYAQGGGKPTQSVWDNFTPGPATMSTQCAFQCPALLETVR